MSASVCTRRGARDETTYIVSFIDTGVWATLELVSILLSWIGH